ncbi:unnamed protein product [Peronospora belbahrii]|uniref:Uncharacterized protein n=1 Tax=Peronospora belbahrii TaxID=622444 RepID=A0ABN8D9Z0_9STRA|nr:unnamed protein product [Peronospora belbahrii]
MLSVIHGEVQNVENYPQKQCDPPVNMSTSITTEEISAEKKKTHEPDCFYEGGKFYAGYLDQHMAILTETMTPTMEITIDDVQVGDQDIPLTEYQTLATADQEAPPPYN